MIHPLVLNDCDNGTGFLKCGPDSGQMEIMQLSKELSNDYSSQAQVCYHSTYDGGLLGKLISG